ncbi:MAG: hypothetical protein A3F43_01005 [Gammaproteobacteria bacterium RIFCSPHIGHO2_12_FULL_42_10]|nr:MAG: hypothetical protein A3F43_01005 [Gammaproteobacteria bacterium RIFCSPHIGHO2_12_FULL_42_10]
MLALSSLFSTIAIASSAPQSDPVALLQFIANNMIHSLKAEKASLKSNPSVVYSIANRYVVPYADLSEMSRRVVPPATWNQATPAQRAQFQKEFTRTLIRTYASALTAYKDQTVQFYPVRGGVAGKNSVEVLSEIDSSDNQPINVNYRLIRVGNIWRMIDLSVDGVDMLESFRSQFSDILSHGSMSALLKRMSEHNSR